MFPRNGPHHAPIYSEFRVLVITASSSPRHFSRSRKLRRKQDILSAFRPTEITMEDVYALLTSLRGRYNQRELADALGITTRTLRRWEAKETFPPTYLADAIRQRLLPLMEPVVAPAKRAFNRTGNWSREQSMLAFRFYCETPFGKLHGRNRNVIQLAQLIGRTPSALAMKCVNFASLDPTIRESGRKGLSNASSLDREIWNEFHANWEALVEECEALQTYLLRNKEAPREPYVEDELADVDFTGEARIALVKQRVKQAFFRRSVLSSYGDKCCVSGLSDKRFLIASHIVAWREDASIRLHPGNGLCLSAIHDKAFDQHLFSLTDDRRILLSDQLKKTKDDFLRKIFWTVDDKKIALPEKFSPEPAFIARHRKQMLVANAE